jgi:hypothetical protein
MFHQSSLPTLQEAISAISQKESRLKVMREDTSNPSRPTFAAMRDRDARECYNYVDIGHIARDCPKPFKSNRGRGRGGTRGASKGTRGRGGRSGYKTNLAGVKEEISMPSETLSLELEKSKERQRGGGTKHQDQETHYGDFINFPYMNEGNYANTYVRIQISRLNWILDSGASRHVTGASIEFASYSQHPTPPTHTHKETIQIADGTS